MPNFESMTLDTLIDFERDMEMGNLKPYYRSHDGQHAQKMPGKVLFLSAKDVSQLIDGDRSKIGSSRYVLLYQGYATWPGHDQLLELLGKMSEAAPYRDHITFGFKSLAHNQGVHFDDEGLTLFDLKDAAINKMDITADLDHHELDQWLRINVAEIVYADHTDL